MYKKLAFAADPAFDSKFSTPVRFRYAIVSQQRTGSSWLCSLLANTEYFGVPAEYLNPRSVPQMRKRLLGSSGDTSDKLPLKTYMQAVERVRTSSLGIFGIKIQPNQLARMFGDKPDAMTSFLGSFDRLIFLTRQDKLAQAVSGAISQATDRWRGDGTEPDLTGVDMEKLLLDVLNKLKRYIHEDDQIHSIQSILNRPVLSLKYEELLAAPDDIFDQVVRFLGWKAGSGTLLTQSILPIPMRAEGKVAQKLRAMFLDFIQGKFDSKAHRSADAQLIDRNSNV
jgi:LPS sulfotransferase NodH